MILVCDPRVHVEKLTFGRDCVDKQSGVLNKVNGHSGDVNFAGGDIKNPNI